MRKSRERVFDLYLAVAFGGAIGACARNAMELALPTQAGNWPLATFLVNISGALLIGLVLAFANVRYPDPKLNNAARRFRPFFITGVLGGYTTFSTFMVETHGLIANGELLKAILYILTSTFVGVAACLLGLWLGGLVVRSIGLKPTAAAAVAAGLADVVDVDEG